MGIKGVGHVQARASLIAAYIPVWGRAILSEEPPSHPALPPRLAYVDLYGGPDRGAPAARAVLGAVVAALLSDQVLEQDLVMLLNDPGAEEDADARGALLRELDAGKDLVHRPQVIRHHPWPRISARIKAYKPLGTLIHFEPWGLVSLGGGDLRRCLSLPRAELLLSLRYSLLNMGLGNERMAIHLDAFWGTERAEALRDTIRGLSPHWREEHIVAACVERLRELGAEHVLAFRFSDSHRLQTLLFHASHDVAAYARMKEHLACHATGGVQGVPDYRYNPEEAHYEHILPVARPLDALVGELAHSYAGQTIVPDAIYQRDHVGRPFIRQNYYDALDALIAEGRARRLGQRVRVLG